ncbi:MAG: molybdenum cofactor guanylyltransferase [Dehalococcoidia bacterium]|nr:molybdenum cofactor guanylyltransferase [Dehalococcoidia bacterium]
MPPDVTAVILAGGRSSRLGVDKCGLKLDGTRTILESLVTKLAPLCAEVLVVSDEPRDLPLGVRLVLDMAVGAGPVRGLYSGLSASGTEHAFAVACDMPFLNSGLIEYMLSLPRDYDVLVPRLRSMALEFELHPLHAIYSRRCLPLLSGLSTEDGIRAIYPQVRTIYLGEAAIDAIDPRRLSFFNINTLEDLGCARELAGTV